jgi:hypothetical protein
VLPKFHDKKRAACSAGGPVRTGGLLISIRAVAVAAEAEVEAGFHHVFGFIDTVDEGPPVVLNESEITITEVVVIVLDETRDKVGECVVCTENLILVDYVTESPNVNGDDRAALLLADPVRLAIQVEGPT